MKLLEINCIVTNTFGVSFSLSCRCFFVEIINFHYLAFFFFFVVVPSSLIITILYILIFNAIRKQLNKMASNTCASQYADKVAPPGDDANKKSMGGRRWRKEVQIAKVLFMIIVFFFASWYPLFTANFVSAFFYMVPFPTVRVLIYISHANSAINPFLYGIASQEFRSEYGRVFARIFCCRAAQEVAVEVSSTSGQQTKPPQSLSAD
ncbi:PREDICTED: adenosine receptor A1-like [Priapulus caudatus]|uniref:Adenosine receptor A1-like n=1 Tax=Priapulus caudatus TaxID=37621 RepID=A0ABM1EQ12_PRICU|nr:PREDICTED: adenosine receptor A1-like [Priapulus caudatus]